jgi:hypothetical protein
MTTIPDKTVGNQIPLQFQPADFFHYNSNLTPSDVDCKQLLLFEGDCEKEPTLDCYRKELCINKNLANDLLKTKNNHLEVETRKTDTEQIYDKSKLKTLNFIGGILAMFFIMIV